MTAQEHLKNILDNFSGNEVVVYKGNEALLPLKNILTEPAPQLKRERIVDYINKTRQVLYNLVKHLKPEKVVELGVRDGYSTTAIVKALVENGSGELDSFDPVWDEERFVRENLVDNLRWFYHEMTGEDGYEWAKNEYYFDDIDLLYIDTDPHEYSQTRMWFNEYWIHNVRPGGYIALDDCSPYFQEGIDPSKVPDRVEGYEIMNKGIWGVLRAIVEFVEEQDDKIEFAFSLYNHSSPGTAIIKLKDGCRI